MAAPIDLREEWRDLLARRPALSPSLAPYGRLLDAWAGTEPAIAPPWSAADCRDRWRRGTPLLSGIAIDLEPERIERLLDVALGLLASVAGADPASLQRFAEAWDAGRIRAASLLPRPGRVGSIEDSCGLTAEALGFVACASLRPHLERLLDESRAHLEDGAWELGACPFCGGPPGFADIREDGRRQLACHLCGGQWIFPRLRCPFCGTDRTSDLGRLDLAGTEEGYFLSTCSACRAYLKELDRRVRWNGGSALVEDWGSPHFDLAARRAGYWRPVPPLLCLVGGGDPPPATG
jgi:FdhE protein